MIPLLRGLVRSPLFATAAILSLALGIGANTAMFSLIDRILLQTLPVKDPERLANIYAPGPWEGSQSTDEDGGPSFSYILMREMQADLPKDAFVGLAGSRAQVMSIGSQDAAPGRVRLVSGNYFSLLGVGSALGRVLTPEDAATPGGLNVAVLSHHYWVSKFGANPAVLNQTIRLNGVSMTVVGVAQAGYVSENRGDDTAIFVPITMRDALTPDAKDLERRRNAWITLFVRLQPGVTMAQGETKLAPLYAGQMEKVIAEIKQTPGFIERLRARRMHLRSGEHGRGGIRDEAQGPLLMLAGVTLVVLLIGCVNVANLQIARGAAREKELALRLAVGASRWRVIQGPLMESTILALIGGTLGLLLSYATIQTVLSEMPNDGGASLLISAAPDFRVFTFALVFSILTGLIAGLAPALRAARADPATALKDQAGQAASGSAGRLRKFLVTAQIAMSALLLVCGGLFAKSLVNLSRIDLGIRADHLLTFSVSPRLNRYSNERAQAFNREFNEKLQAIPGVTLVASSIVPVISGSNSSQGITVQGFVSTETMSSNYDRVSPGYFRTMGRALVAGREFEWSDDAKAQKVVVINEAFARKYLPGRDPIGMHMANDRRNTDAELDRTIVGIVKDAKYSQVKDPPPPVFYVPISQESYPNFAYFYVRSTVDPESLAPQIRKTLTSMDPGIPIRALRTMEQQVRENMLQDRIVSKLTAMFAVLATLLAALGLYGVLAYQVARRTKEMAIRMALGAGSGSIRGLVVKEVAVLAGIGAALGLAGAAGLGRLVASMLYGTLPWDPVVYAGTVTLVAVIAFAAAYLPAHRATQVDPMTSLRHE